MSEVLRINIVLASENWHQSNWMFGSMFYIFCKVRNTQDGV